MHRMNVRGLWSALRDLPYSDSELDIYLPDGRKVTSIERRDSPEEGPHVVLVLEPPADAPDENGGYRAIQGVVRWKDNGDGTYSPEHGVVRWENRR